MSECRFQFDFSGSGSALVDGIRRKMIEAGGRLEGSDAIGSFALPTPVGEFEGTYSIERNTIWVEVREKPFFVPCSAIEAKLRALVSARGGSR